MARFTDGELLRALYEIDMLSDSSVNEWEASFIESNLERDATDSSPKQRDIIEKMIERYLE